MYRFSFYQRVPAYCLGRKILKQVQDNNPYCLNALWPYGLMTLLPYGLMALNKTPVARIRDIPTLIALLPSVYNTLRPDSSQNQSPIHKAVLYELLRMSVL